MADQATLDKAFALTDDPSYKPGDFTGYTIDVNNLDLATDETAAPAQVSYVVTRTDGPLGLGAYPSRAVVDQVIAADKTAVAKAAADNAAAASAQDPAGIASNDPNGNGGSAAPATPSPSASSSTPAAGTTVSKG